MSKRKDIIDASEVFYARTGLVYSEILGWIDLGHAQGEDIKKLIYGMEQGERSSNEIYTISYSQTMYKFLKNIFGVGMHARWQIKKGRPLDQRFSIALAMMMSTAVNFERMQASLPFIWFTDSGFSAEDLVSDLLGFYRAVRPMNYFPFLKLISRKEALKRWDYYGPVGNYKNKLFKPLIFPDPTKNKYPKPFYGELPKFMMSIKPFADYHKNIVKVITNNGAHANILTKPKSEFE
ncbi:hypothetical protein C7M52_02838 [Mixta theicola]|nr:hypothetical protein [Mixta theicola]QHM76852.1 hypothetical protein C7M52_02838 [Mixta theicola]